MRTRTVLLGVALIAGVSACGGPSTHGDKAAPATSGSSVDVKVGPSSLGQILTDQDGRTLYAFTRDTGGASSCTGECLATWPALVSTHPFGAGDGTERKLLSKTPDGGVAQATYNNWPLYYYVGDTGPGDVSGQGVDGVWYVVGADGKLIRKTS